jgi:hypothetical protein
MIGRELKQILFEPWGGLNDPLFSSQRELARRVVEQESTRYSKPQTLAAFINQILLDHRPCPDQLADEIVAVAREAALATGEETLADQVEERLRLVLRPDASAEEAQIDRIYHRQVRAQEVVIVNPMTLEGGGHQKSDDFQGAMFDTLLEDEWHKPGRYVFVLDKELDQQAVLHWKRTVDGLTARFAERQKLAEADARAAALDKLTELNEAERLLVVGVHRSLCIVPMVAFDPQGELDDCDIYVWDTHVEADADGHGIAELGRFVKLKWINDFYGRVLFPISARPVGDPLSIANVEFKSVKPRL